MKAVINNYLSLNYYHIILDLSIFFKDNCCFGKFNKDTWKQSLKIHTAV